MATLVLYINFIEWHSEWKKGEGEGWRTELQQENQQWSEMLKLPELTEEDRTFYQEQIAVNNYHLEENIRSTKGTMWMA